MGFTFLHAADLHLGSPLAGLATKDAEIAARFGSACRDAFSELVSRAIAEGVAFAVIAGDVYDGEWKDTSVGLFFNREVARLDRAGIPVFLIRGNHDAESEVTKAVPLPAGVTLFPSSRARTERLAELQVAIHGRSFADRVASDNFALAYPDPVHGWFNIGVLHTSCDGRPPHAVYAPCSVQDLASRGYQYWALGHVHDYEVLARDPWIVFPGNLQGRSVRECGPKGAVFVDVEDGRVSNARRVIVDRARWASVAVDLAGVDDEAAFRARVGEALKPAFDEAAGTLLAFRLTLEGETNLHRRLKGDPGRFRDEAQALADHLREDVWLERLRIETREPARPRVEPADGAGLDPQALLEGLERDEGLRAAARKRLDDVLARIPAGIPERDALAEDLDGLLADARALVLGRAVEGGG
ncbi:DNA repair exonuclease [Alsobacter sp. SYSU M60028]|uniref:DNA repair exonuclease n=1 Tax=Alsobacter ponti TaxID=2962936 RepID=A0ABT1L8R0_9HYPH|nr:DNA repair exonuclease [Alsobacter ponti]MCP8937885.1 DNA repair exonuclease [Alsobacter ponti]